MTYSINNGTSTEAFGWNDINIILNELPDNTSSLITPHDLRDAVYTVWQGIAIKPTKNSSNIEYLGIDQNNLYEKIFLGKKQVSGVDILTTQLLNSDVDLFIYNNKTDGFLTSQDTKVGFLAGGSTSVFYYNGTSSFPYLETKVINNLYGNVLDFNIKNDSYNTNGATTYGGNISLFSKYGNVLINGIVFPTYAQNIPGVVADNSILTYKNIGGNAYVQWSANTPYINSITASGTFSIVSDNITLNGFNIQFTDSRPVSATFGSIIAGSTFSGVALIEMIRMMLYGYVPPRLVLTPYSYFVEVNSGGTVAFNYSITKVTATSSMRSIISTPLFLTGGATGSALTYLNGAPSINRTYNSTASYTSGSLFTTTGIKAFTMSVNDNVGGTTSIGTTVNTVYPIFYGTSLTASATQSVVQSLLSTFTKVVDSNINKTVPISGTGVCIYYCVPAASNVGGTISSIYDTSFPLTNIKNNFRTSGMAFTMSLSSPSGYWGSTVYNCYIYSPSSIPSKTTLGVFPTYATNYQFNF
jgi:hypothetical protein